MYVDWTQQWLIKAHTKVYETQDAKLNGEI